VTFLVIKYFEYTHKFHDGIYPGTKLYERTAHAEGGVAQRDAPSPVAAAATAGIYTPAARPDLPPVEPSKIARAAIGPGGLAQEPEHVEHHLTHPLQDPDVPDNIHMFFNIYFMMTGLHGIHVLIGIIVLTWLLIGATKGRFTSEYFTPIDLGGLYWHVVDLIWIFLFPLFYLI